MLLGFGVFWQQPFLVCLLYDPDVMMMMMTMMKQTAVDPRLLGFGTAGLGFTVGALILGV